MHRQIMVSQSEQYQMNGALIGLLVGLGSGLIIFGGIDGMIMGGVFGLFGGTLLGAATNKLNHTTGRLLIGLVILLLAIVLIRNIYQDISSLFTSSSSVQDPSQLDELYYLEQEGMDLR